MFQAIIHDGVAVYTIVACAVYLTVLALIARRYVTAFSFGVWVMLTITATLILVSSRVPWPGVPEWTAFWHWFHSINGEYNLLATFSTAQLLVVGMAAFVTSLWMTRGTWFSRLYWVMVALVFFAMTADEYYQLHEGHQWVPVYAAVGGALAAASFFVYWREPDQFPLIVFVFLFGGLGLMAAGGVVLEYAAARDCTDFPSWFSFCRHVPYIEEASEVVGVSLSLAGVLTYAQRHMTPLAWRHARVTLAAGSLGGILILLASFWVMPRLEAQYRADAVDVSYFRGQLALVGYRVSGETFRPGDEMKVEFFWQARDWIHHNFNMSVQLLTVPDAQKVAEERVLITDPPASSWVRGLVRKQSATIVVPEGLKSPASLVLTVPIWFEGNEEYQLIPIKQSDVQTFNEYLPSLQHITVLPDYDVPDPVDEVVFHFGSGFSLDGVTLPSEVTDVLDVTFWWSSAADLDTELVQIFHLREVDSGATFVFDQPPFGGSFPTSDWVAGMHVMDEWTLALPDAMPPGNYHVLTGMYDLQTGSREHVTDRQAQPLSDNLVDLGVVRKLE